MRGSPTYSSATLSNSAINKQIINIEMLFCRMKNKRQPEIHTMDLTKEKKSSDLYYSSCSLGFSTRVIFVFLIL